MDSWAAAGADGGAAERGGGSGRGAAALAGGDGGLARTGKRSTATRLKYILFPKQTLNYKVNIFYVKETFIRFLLTFGGLDQKRGAGPKKRRGGVPPKYLRVIFPKFAMLGGLRLCY